MLYRIFLISLILVASWIFISAAIAVGGWEIAVLPVVCSAGIIFFGAGESIAGVVLATIILEPALAVPLGMYALSVAVAGLFFTLAERIVQLEPLTVAEWTPSVIVKSVSAAVVGAVFIAMGSQVVGRLGYGFPVDTPTILGNVFSVQQIFGTAAAAVVLFFGWRRIAVAYRFRRRTW